MRLQLIAALALLVRPVLADPGAEATIRIYTDDDDITVVSPAVRAETEIARTTVEVDATADAVSGASIDVVTAASPLPISDRRVELGLGAAHPVVRAGNLTLSSSLRGSVEKDHAAFRVGAGVRLDLLDRLLTLDTRYVGGRDAIGTVVDPAFDEERVLHQLTTAASVILDPRTIVDVVAEGTRSSGYHASPYRRVPVIDPDWPTPAWVDEQVPALRRSVAGAARLRRAVGNRWFGTLGYRVYLDDWSIESHTVTVEVRSLRSRRVLVGVLARGYVQDGAHFYRSSYSVTDEMSPWRTRDRTLGPMRTLFGSMTADLALGDAGTWHALVAAGVLASWFLDFPLQSDRHALVVTLSLSRSFGGDE